jgi:hypothetical protein
MRGRDAITAFCTAHPQWNHMRNRFTTKERDGWQYIIFDNHLDVGRVRVAGREIQAELLISYTKLG